MVEKKLARERGITRQELGREAFLKEACEAAACVCACLRSRWLRVAPFAGVHVEGAVREHHLRPAAPPGLLAGLVA